MHSTIEIIPLFLRGVRSDTDSGSSRIERSSVREEHVELSHALAIFEGARCNAFFDGNGHLAIERRETAEAAVSRPVAVNLPSITSSIMVAYMAVFSFIEIVDRFSVTRIIDKS
jgi:hypothetical protein